MTYQLKTISESLPVSRSAVCILLTSVISYVGLGFIGIVLAVLLCGSETFQDGKRNIFRFDQFNHIMLVSSAAESLSSLNFPPRVSNILTEGLGNPFHQFYSPLVHSSTAIISLLTGDSISGYSVSVVLLLAFSFASMFRLGLYFTGSKACSFFAALMFVTAPYLHADRTLRGAYAEYFAFCLLPAVTYLNLRALNLRSIKYWLFAVFATSALMLSHLITAFYFLLFSAMFIMFSGISVVILYYSRVRSYDENSPVTGSITRSRHLRSFIRKFVGAGTIAFAALLISMWYMGPVLFYDDLVVKKEILTGTVRASQSGFITSLLAVLNLRDVPFIWKEQYSDFSRYQAGFLVVASVAIFAWYNIKERGVYARPFLATTCIIFLFTVFPSVLGLPLLKNIDIAQFSFRFLAHLTLAGSIAGALALMSFFKSRPGYCSALRWVTVIVLSSLALSLSAPYLYPKSFPYSSVESLTSSDITVTPRMEYGETMYLRPAPSENYQEWIAPDRRALPSSGGIPGKFFFCTDLDDYRHVYGGPPGQLILDVLYFPGLQEIQVSVDGVVADVIPDTWWQKRAVVRQDFSDIPGAFHGLRLTGLPEKGLAEIRVTFTGMKWANLVSAASFFLLVLCAATSKLLSRSRRHGVSPSSQGMLNHLGDFSDAVSLTSEGKERQ